MIPRIMPAKSVTYNSQNYAGTLGSGLGEGRDRRGTVIGGY